jgi:hypothetical protein
LEVEREIYAADSPFVHNRAVMEKCEVRKQQGLYREALSELSRVYAYALDTETLIGYYQQRTLVAYLAGEFDTSLAALDEMRASLPESTPTPTMILVEALAAGEKGDWERSQKAANHYASTQPNGDTLTAESHIETLTPSTIRANARFFEKEEDVPTTAITMGMKGILSAKRLVLVATGAAKADAIRQLVCGGEVTTHNPSTFLKLHADAWVVIDRALAEAAGYNG